MDLHNTKNDVDMQKIRNGRMHAQSVADDETYIYIFFFSIYKCSIYVVYMYVHFSWEEIVEYIVKC